MIRVGRSVLAAIAGICLVAGSQGCSSRGEYPTKPIVLICPWSPGGGTDRVSRQIAVQLQRELDVPVNVVNATGGGGVTGHTRGAVARPDGYTLMMATVELNMLHWRGLTEISHRDFEPLALLNRDDSAILVRQDAPWQSITELESEIRRRPGKLKASGTARGGIWHIALAGWLTARDMQADDVTWISINGAGPSLQELMAEGVDLVCCSVPEAQALIDGGQVRCLGVMADERLPAAPDVPTFREMGIDWSLGGWRGLALPKEVPAERAVVLEKAVLRVAQSEEFAQFMDLAGFKRTVAGPEEFEEFLIDADEQFGQILSSPAFVRVSQSPLGPMFFPGVVTAIGTMIAIALLCRGRLQLSAGTSRLSREDLTRVALVPVGIGLFILTSDTVGFVLAAGVMLLGLLLMLRVPWAVAVVLTIVLVPSVYHVFAVQLGVPLPWGWLGW